MIGLCFFLLLLRSEPRPVVIPFAIVLIVCLLSPVSLRTVVSLPGRLILISSAALFLAPVALLGRWVSLRRRRIPHIRVFILFVCILSRPSDEDLCLSSIVELVGGLLLLLLHLLHDSIRIDTHIVQVVMLEGHQSKVIRQSSFALVRIIRNQLTS